MSKIEIKKINIPAKELLGETTFLGAEFRPRYVDSKLVENDYNSVEVRFVSSVQQSECAISIPFYEYGTDKSLLTEEEKKQMINAIQGNPFGKPIEFVDLQAGNLESTMTKVEQGVRNSEGKWENKIVPQSKVTANITARYVTLAKSVAGNPNVNIQSGTSKQ